MASTKKGLGRGLSALIPDQDMEFLTQVARGDIAVAPPRTRGKAALEEANGDPAVDVQWIEIAQVAPNPFQPRRTFNQQELEELADSVRTHGVLQPILVRPAGGQPEPYQLIAGERRWRAAQLAGLTTVPAIVRPVGDQQALELALIENVQRHDISALDAAVAYKRLITEFALSQDEVAVRVGKSRSAVANTMRLLDLSEEAQRAIEAGKISEGHGRAILQAPTRDSQRAILRRVLRDGLSVREAEQLARAAAASRGTGGERPPQPRSSTEDVEIKHLEKRLEKALGAPVHIREQGTSGQVVIDYFDAGDLNRLVTALLKK